jgi:hypothetical protein
MIEGRPACPGPRPRAAVTTSLRGPPAAAEAAIGLRELKTDVAAAKHDQMPRQVIELESLDMRERLGGSEP